jgi:hypothetical protein
VLGIADPPNAQTGKKLTFYFLPVLGISDPDSSQSGIKIKFLFFFFVRHPMLKYEGE